MKNTPSDKSVVGTSLVVSISDVALNLMVGLVTGSQTMFSQALQGLSDLTTAGVLYVGVNQSNRKPDGRHPLGYGREVFFWVLVAAMFMFLGTGLFSVVLGYQQIVDPGEITNLWLALSMLSFGFISNGYSFSRSFIRLHQSGKGKAAWKRQLISSSLVETKATFTLDFLGSVSALIGLLSLGIYAITGDARLDGVGSFMVGVSMMVAASALIVDVKSLIIGRTAPEATQAKIKQLTIRVKHVQDVLDLRTIYMGSSKMLILIEVHLDDDLNTDAIEKVLDEVKLTLRQEIPAAYHVQVEVETPDSELSSV